jgi:hypothetical protein
MGIDLPHQAEENLERLAEHFLFNSPYRSLFLERLIDWTPFRGTPNRGHIAIADFLACQILQVGVSTNFDELIESAAEALGEPLFEPALAGNDINPARPHMPLLKIHGCVRKDRNQILWCREQITRMPAEPIATRLASSTIWLRANLPNRDLLIVGFWTDWAYLNSILEEALAGVAPGMVFLTDTAPAGELEEKAPRLWALATGRGGQFVHTQQSGAQFLDEFRKVYSLRFFSKVLDAGSPGYQMRYGQAPTQNHLLPEDADSTELYELRRDLFGTPGIIRDKAPNVTMELAGIVHLRLQAKGAVFSGPRYQHGGRLVRVINGAGRVLSHVKQAFSPRHTQAGIDEVIICAGAEDDGGAPSDLVRDATPPTVIRPEGGVEWLTISGAEGLLT